MNTNTELIGCVQHDCAKCKAQADAIEALEKQHIERLLRIETKVDELVTERDALQAQLAAAQGQLQQAFNWFESIDKTACESEDSINKSRKLFAVARDARIAMAALKAAPIPQQPSVPEGWKQAVALAYGHLWHVNNEPMAPIALRSSETAAYEARKQLRDLLTREERGLAINQVQALLAAAPQPKEKQ